MLLLSDDSIAEKQHPKHPKPLGKSCKKDIKSMSQTECTEGRSMCVCDTPRKRALLCRMEESKRAREGTYAAANEDSSGYKMHLI